ncbi:PREDICTED: lipase 3-like [Cyphomyrmex costatus]|uniref:lipase 3-like n=1 Tax=Cyphomyrmex costatus TaxID=456900 RepID=UPI00085232A6|nr:PREDICTED: lipase 3-like [Cyphomyrmex costatus]
MLLLIFLISILASTNAGLLNNLINEIPKLNPLEQIPFIPDLLIPTIPEEARFTTMEFINKYGYDGETHKVTTKDGYILELHRITGQTNFNNSQVQKPVVFVMHGILCSSVCWVISRPERSIAFLLVNEGYDVWLGNTRGNSYANNHTSHNIKEKDYWNFSWHEIGIYDLPAMIDHIVKTTGQKKIFYIGHSQGTTSFFVMATKRPKYQNYIKEMYALAPIAYCGRMKSPFLQILAQFTGIDQYFWNLIGMYKFNPNDDFMKTIRQLVCAEKAATQQICSNFMFLLCGFNVEQFDMTLLPIIAAQFPVSISTKQLVHYGQLIQSVNLSTGSLLLSPGKFKQFDYGILGNTNTYKLLSPPNYDLSNIKAPVYLFYSDNDWLANVKDVEKLYSELGNPSGKTLIAHKKFNHIDYMWAKDVKKLLYDRLIRRMKKSS